MSNVIAFPRDHLMSLVSRMGTERDKAASTFYATPTWTDQQLVDAYRGSWLPQKIVNIPALDSCRKWRNWQADAKKISLIEAEEKRLNIRGKVLDARIKARLFGGAAIFIGDGSARLDQPFEPERIGKGGIRYLTVMTSRALKAGEIDRDPASETYGKPKDYTITSGTNGQVTIHPSRLVLFVGAPRPDDDLVGGIQDGWGDSVLVAAMEAIKNADATPANIASLVFEAKVDVIQVPELMASLADPAYEQRLLNRFALAATAKGINGTLILDKEEEYTSKSASFATLPDVIRSFLEIAAGAADIPLTRLLGTSPGGLQSTGQTDLRNYYDRVQAAQELEMQPPLQRLDEALIRSALGSRPEDIHYRWAPLWQVSETELAEIGAKNATTISTLAATGLFPPEGLANSAANMLVENGILPGLDQAIEDAGGLPDYEMEAEKEAEAERQRLEASRKSMGDAAPRSLYIRRDVLNAAEIVAWAKGQGFETVQQDLHVTIMHTRTPMDWIKVGSGDEWTGSDGKMEIAAGGPRLMERFGEAVVLQFASSRLTWRHEDIKRMGAETDHPEYQPHITISWQADDLDLSKVQPYQGKILLGPEVFEEVKENWRAGIVEDGGAPLSGETFR